MAYITQDEKKAIAAELKKIIPATWKYSLALRDYSTIVLTVASAPVDLLQVMRESDPRAHIRENVELTYHRGGEPFKANPEIEKLFDKIIRALKGADWHDNSDSQTDYFDIAYYIRINIGRWDKPFQVSGNDGKPLISSND